jgi:hypothetical protein
MPRFNLVPLIQTREDSDQLSGNRGGGDLREGRREGGREGKEGIRNPHTERRQEGREGGKEGRKEGRTYLRGNGALDRPACLGEHG